MLYRFCLLALTLDVASGFRAGAPVARPTAAMAASSSIVMKGAPVEEKKGAQN